MSKSDEQWIASAQLKDWLAKNPRVPPLWRTVAERLAARDADLAKMWRSVGEENAMLVLSAACTASERARSESSREPATDEAANLERVKRCAEALKEAIELSPLPRSATLIEVTGEGAQPVPLWLAWRDEMSGPGSSYSLSLVKLMELTSELVDSHKRSLSPRATARARAKLSGGNPERSAFVRWLAWELRLRKLASGPMLLARIANAVLQLPDVVDQDGVKAILRDQPEEFKGG